MNPLERARRSLEGLSVGDAFGERFFGAPERVLPFIASRTLPAAPWFWTDDTAMALSVVDELEDRGGIDPGSLARRFAARYARDPVRGYGGTAHEILAAIGRGEPWAEVARAVHGGEGSMGNGAAMRVAPIGAYFAEDLELVVHHARGSAAPTHAHPEGAAGAIAIAVAAALATRAAAESAAIVPQEFLHAVHARVPDGATREGLALAIAIGPAAGSDLGAISSIVERLGNGSRVIAEDTVPFALHCAAHALGRVDGSSRFEEALWATVAGLGDRDTTCAMVGGVVAAFVGADGIPAAWRAAREPLDSTLTSQQRYGS